jgi:acyl-CoA dehydrogenase
MTKIELQSSPPSSKTLAAMARLLLRGGSLVRSALTSSSVTLTHTRCVSSFSGMSEDGLSESQIMVRHSIQDLCKPFDDDYWLQKDRKQEYPHELYDSLAAQGWIGICMPSSFGGAGLGISEATIMLQTIAESGASVAGAQR